MAKSMYWQCYSAPPDYYEYDSWGSIDANGIPYVVSEDYIVYYWDSALMNWAEFLGVGGASISIDVN